MKKFGRIATKFGGLIASIALLAGVASAQSACVFMFHQPKVPQGMSKFTKAR